MIPTLPLYHEHKSLSTPFPVPLHSFCADLCIPLCIYPIKQFLFFFLIANNPPFFLVSAIRLDFSRPPLYTLFEFPFMLSGIMIRDLSSSYRYIYSLSLFFIKQLTVLLLLTDSRYNYYDDALFAAL